MKFIEVNGAYVNVIRIEAYGVVQEFGGLRIRFKLLSGNNMDTDAYTDADLCRADINKIKNAIEAAKA